MHEKYHLITAIYNEPWLLSIDYNMGYINALIAGVTNPNISAEVDADDYSPVQSGSVIVIPITGVLTKYDGFCGAPGMMTYGKIIKSAINDSSVDAIVLSIDSPGGQFYGTQTLGDIIESSPKPIVAFIDDCACSGGFWLASKCKAVVANTNNAVVGSIGVMATYIDLQKANEMSGRKEHVINAPQSKDKNLTHKKVMNGDYSAVEAELRVIADTFISVVKAGRPKATSDQLTGKTFFASEVIGTLVDSVGSLDSAISLALSFIETNNTTNMSKNQHQKTTRLAAVVGVESFEAAAEGVTLNEEQLDAIDAHLATTETYQTQVADLTAQLETANQSLTTVTSERDALKVRIAELEATTPGSNPSVVTPAVDGHVTSPSAKNITRAQAETEAAKYLN